VEADEAKKCLSQTEPQGRSPRSIVRRVFFGAAGARKQKHGIFRQPKPFLPRIFVAIVSGRGDPDFCLVKNRKVSVGTLPFLVTKSGQFTRLRACITKIDHGC
jgi:hypothetical protein